MVLALTASAGRSMRSLSATCSGDLCLLRMSEATSERSAGSLRALGRLKTSLRPSVLAWAVDAL
ncbi:hypothetical protein ACTND8_09520 [Atopobiaceae bacterium HCP3S3_F7]